MVYAVETKICVSTTGDVDTVTLAKPSDTALDASVLNTVKTWRYPAPDDEQYAPGLLLPREARVPVGPIDA